VIIVSIRICEPILLLLTIKIKSLEKWCATTKIMMLQDFNSLMYCMLYYIQTVPCSWKVPGNSFMLLGPFPPTVSMSSQPPPFHQTNLASCWDISYMLQISQRDSSTENKEEKNNKTIKNTDLRY